MTIEEIKTLGEKVGKNEATDQEKSLFFAELNSLLEGMRADVAEVKSLNKN